MNFFLDDDETDEADLYRNLPLSDDGDDLDDSDDDTDPWTSGDDYEADGYFDGLAGESEALHFAELGVAIW